MSWEDMLKAQEKEPKKVFVDVYTDWCGWCKRMDAHTFTHPEVIKLMNQYFYAVKFDAEGDDIIIHKGKTYTNPHSFPGKKDTHQFAKYLLNGQLSYPTIVMLSENLDSYGPIPGYRKPADLIPMLKFIGEEKFKTQSWEEYISQYNQ
jgi:thioredoxin-related protein